ncbi:MAG: RnfABCDGE type electron transport complex subunit D [Clostridia bacterium]|nr:RnfABCDGE type electron transport complex subunit D [Clostridia bacterium]
MKQLTVSSSPHIRSNASTNRIMLDVIIALLPASIAGIVIFGWRALLVLSLTVASAVLAEFIFNLIVKKEQTIGDLSAVVTGLLIGLNVRADAPIWQCVLGAVFAIVVVKCFFGGLGCNFANPAITGRIFMMICFAATIGGGTQLITNDAGEKVFISSATPLYNMQNGGELPSLLDMFLGDYGGAIGETCTIALIIGFVYLVVRRVINVEIPLIFVGTVFVFSLIVDNSFSTALYHVLGGGLILGAVFMATDYVTTPITRSGKMIFAFGAGLITYLIRSFGNYAEGVSFAILIMNIVSPYIEKWTAKRPLGGNVK